MKAGTSPEAHVFLSNMMFEFRGLCAIDKRSRPQHMASFTQMLPVKDPLGEKGEGKERWKEEQARACML